MLSQWLWKRAIRTETDMPNDAGLPADASLDQQVT
jgi:hypothetical protein